MCLYLSAYIPVGSLTSLFVILVGLLVERDQKYGGNVKYATYEEMEVAYAKEVSFVVIAVHVQ